MKTVKGNLITMAQDGEFDIIAHGCNCFCAMGAGIALQIKKAFPEAYWADCNTEKGDRRKLGTLTWHWYGYNDLTIVNLYTQYKPQPPVDYKAVRKSMAMMTDMVTTKCRIGLPMIGAGLAGGDWNRIEAIIAEELAGMDVTIVEYDG